jgi:hypothetical protein
MLKLEAHYQRALLNHLSETVPLKEGKSFHLVAFILVNRHLKSLCARPHLFIEMYVLGTYTTVPRFLSLRCPLSHCFFLWRETKENARDVLSIVFQRDTQRGVKAFLMYSTVL